MTIAGEPKAEKAPVIKGTLGLFVSPAGELFPVDQSHINTVILNPARFGITTQEIQAAYARHREPLGLEGKARAEILQGIVEKGWIRLRRYVKPREQWSVTVSELNDRTRSLLREWAGAMLTGEYGYREDDPHKPVVITTLVSSQVRSYTVAAVARGDY